MRRWHLQQGPLSDPEVDAAAAERREHRRVRGQRASPEPESITLENYGRPILEDELKYRHQRPQTPAGPPGRAGPLAPSRLGALPNSQDPRPPRYGPSTPNPRVLCTGHYWVALGSFSHLHVRRCSAARLSLSREIPGSE